ncbi:signal peptide protein [Rhodopirellula maiorica SM1]|uniref:Signal peptide protein n=1 Tax=Rhodopirellula maiorica SM1 TaxID=1265738 RepID=M5RXU7_9BACT|nr:hypothetical protein [Rhodopirellula maiorica]EMI18749.1 signal peptide protein [Rhodopirellula maiorica SM1]
MSGRGRQQLSPTLFPFLAVLVCTLGTLILFLALVAQDSTQKVKRQVEEEARNQANVAQAEAESPVDSGLTAAAVDAMIAEEEFRVSQLVAFRDAQAADVEQRRDQLTHLEDHLRRIQDELKRLSDEVKRATGEETADPIDEASVAELRERLQAEEKSLVELKERVQTQSPRIVIVPHKGPNGTDRRPIYLECTEQGLVIWPEGSLVPMKGLRDSQTGSNPLDEALRVARHHVMQNYGDTVPPYPLLVVRPDGYASYHLSRMALGDWDDQFGVELIPDEVELAIPNADSNLKNRMDEAIQSAIARQRSVATREAIAFGEKRTGKPRPLSAKDLDMQAQSNGYESVRGVPTSGWDLSKGTPYNVNQSGQSQRRGSTTTNVPSEPNQSAAISPRELAQLENEMRRSAAEMRDSAGGGGDGAAAMLLGNPNGNDAGINDASSMASSGSRSSLLGNPATAGANAGGLGSDGSASSDPPSLLASPGGDARMSGLLNQTHGRPESGSGAASNTAGMTLTQPSGASGASSAAGGLTQSDADLSAGNPGAGDSGASKSVRSSGAESGLTMPSYAAMGPRDTASGDTASGTTAFGSDAETTGATGGTSGSQAAGQSSASGSSQAGASSGSGGAGGSSQPPPEGQMAGSAPPQNPNLVKPNKRDWALPDSVAQSRGNSIVRTIRVVCDKGQFVLLGSAMSGGTEVFGFTDKPVSTATLELATAVRDRIDQWGPSLPGGRWSPVLDVEVMPGGEARFEQLRELMQGSGVEVVGKVAQ